MFIGFIWVYFSNLSDIVRILLIYTKASNYIPNKDLKDIKQFNHQIT